MMPQTPPRPGHRQSGRQVTVPWLAVLLTSILATTGCAAKFHSRPLRISTSRAAAAKLQRSLFSRDPQGQLSEARLQRILAAPLDLALPARVGVLPVLTAKDWRGPSPDYARVPAGVGVFVAKLRGSEHFPAVTEIMPIPSGALGMQALREVAARYQLRYVILYREVVRKAARVNGWALAYLTIIGALFAPGRTLDVSGFVEASLFDVKSGLLRFTVRRSIEAQDDTNLWHRRYKQERLQRKLSLAAAPKLARDVRSAVARFLAISRKEDRRRLAAASPGR